MWNLAGDNFVTGKGQGVVILIYLCLGASNTDAKGAPKRQGCRRL